MPRSALVLILISSLLFVGIAFTAYRLAQSPQGPELIEKILLSPQPSIPENNFNENSVDGCVLGGCSGELCVDEADEPVFTTCVYREEYRCYSDALCERQSDGKCGWSSTPELLQCQEDARQP